MVKKAARKPWLVNTLCMIFFNQFTQSGDQLALTSTFDNYVIILKSTTTRIVGPQLFSQLLLDLSLLSNIPLFRKAHNRGKMVNQSRIDHFASFACQTADNCEKSYWTIAEWSKSLANIKGVNKQADIYVGRSLTLYMSHAHWLCMN